MKRFLIIICLILSGLSITQTQTEPSLIPSTPAPQLLLIIMVDISGTMHNENIAVQTDGILHKALPGSRKPSDPEAQRWALVEQIIDVLDSDLETSHSVAVLKFDAALKGWVGLKMNLGRKPRSLIPL